MSYIRIIDANVNRASEGLRVIEDICRFLVCNHSFYNEIKEIRHSLRLFVKHLPLLEFRESEHDVGKNSFTKTEKDRASIEDILVANLKRVEESLRVLEEFFKLENIELSIKIKNLRFKVYTIEQEIFNVKLKFKKLLGQGPILYGIIDTRFSKYNYLKLCEYLIKGGIKIVQLREKRAKDREILKMARTLSQLCKEKNVIFIVNDRVDIAYLVNADGVHLGQDDLPISEAKKILGFNKIFGLSTHNFDQVKEANEIMPDYIGFGPIFTTKSKENPDPVVGVNALKEVKDKLTDIPVVAIGGINETNMDEVISCFPDMICVMSGIISKDNVIEEVLKFRRKINDSA